MKFQYRFRRCLGIFSRLLFVLFTTNGATAQINLESTLRTIIQQGYPAAYIQGYMQPFANALGTVVSGGLYHRASVKNFPSSDLGLNMIFLSLPGEEEYFIYQGEKVPTFFGPSNPGGTTVPGSGLTSLKVPLVQLNMGLFSNFELMVRGYNLKNDEIGKMDLLGVGVKYGLSDLIPVAMFPLEISVQALYHTYNIGNWLSSGTFAMNLHGSFDMSVIPIDIYAGVGYENTSLKIKTGEIPDIGADEVGDISINGENDLRMTLGLSWTFYLLNLHADYNLGFYNSFVAGAMIVF